MAAFVEDYKGDGHVAWGSILPFAGLCGIYCLEVHLFCLKLFFCILYVFGEVGCIVEGIFFFGEMYLVSNCFWKVFPYVWEFDMYEYDCILVFKVRR